jgi:hypothetical protein
MTQRTVVKVMTLDEKMKVPDKLRAGMIAAALYIETRK